MSTAALDHAPNCGIEGTGRQPAGHGRMCVVCRRKAAADAFVLLRQAGLDTQAPASRAGARNGRGAYVCIALACLSRVHQKTLDRALKGAATNLPTQEALLTHLHALAQKRVLDLLGLARRCGMLVNGIDQVPNYLHEPSGLFVIADDLAPRSAAKLAEAFTFLNGERLGRAVGMGFVGAMGIRSGRLATQAAYWLRLWYETNARPRPLAQDKLNGCAGDGDGRGFGKDTKSEKPVEVA